jgi:hypothetical protein
LRKRGRIVNTPETLRTQRKPNADTLTRKITGINLLETLTKDLIPKMLDELLYEYFAVYFFSFF